MASICRPADIAYHALETLDPEAFAPERQYLQYLMIRSLARASATRRARELYKSCKLKAVKEADFQSLDARLLKDEALQNFGPERTGLLKKAARAYERVYRNYEVNKSYNAINAASLYLLAGDPKAERMARATIRECEKEKPDEPRGAARKKPEKYAGLYWYHVTVAEAELVLGNPDRVAERLQVAGSLPYDDFASRASTRKQLKLLCNHLGYDKEILKGLANPDVLFFAGHIIARKGETGRFPADQESHVVAEIEKFLDAHDITAAFGSLAAGADMLVAEACIKRDTDLGIVLPFQMDDFIEVSVRCSGDNWVKRFRGCMTWIEEHRDAEHGAITYATDGAYLDDDSLFTYCASFAMGLAMVRARNLDADARMLAVYDGSGGTGNRDRRQHCHVAETGAAGRCHIRGGQQKAPRQQPETAWPETCRPAYRARFFSATLPGSAHCAKSICRTFMRVSWQGYPRP